MVAKLSIVVAKYVVPVLMLVLPQPTLTQTQNSCCDRVLVSAAGNARLDQPLYLGSYRKHPKDYNGRPVYQKDGKEPLFIYFFYSKKERVSLWVMGPKVGKLIAGISNTKSSACLDQLRDGWKYASKHGVWKNDDSSLKVECDQHEQKRTKINPRKATRKPIQTTKAKTLFDVLGKNSEKSALKPTKHKNSCCNKISVQATGKALVDQPRYLGVYHKHPKEYNGRSVYRREGGQPLYIYFFYSPKDSASLWVIGPKIGKLVAAIRNGKTSQCVETLGSGWKYASSSGIWKQDDPSLKVKCVEEKISTTTIRPTTTSRRTTTITRRPIIKTTTKRPSKSTTKKPTQTKKLKTPKPRRAGKDCEWSSYGPWSQCSQSCDIGFKVRVRQVRRQARGGGKPCRGGNRERKYCNNKRCPSTRADKTTKKESKRRLPPAKKPNAKERRLPATKRPNTITRRLPSTEKQRPPPTKKPNTVLRRLPPRKDPPTKKPNAISRRPTRKPTTRRTTTRRPTLTTTRRSSSVRLPSFGGDRVKCYVCGSLFSSNVQGCNGFNQDDPRQQRFCGADEACLYYSWSIKDKTSSIRECVPSSILIGTIADRVEIQPDCKPASVESEEIQACICTTDLCNSLPSDGTRARIDKNRNKKIGKKQIPKANTIVRNTPKSNAIESTRASTSRNQFFHPDEIGLQCYSCGSLLNRNDQCDSFDRRNSSQVQTCLTDEACLLYSWNQSPTERVTLRECVKTRFLLGPFEDPVLPAPTCVQRDITEGGSGDIFACLCNTDFCNDDLGQI